MGAKGAVIAATLGSAAWVAAYEWNFRTVLRRLMATEGACCQERPKADGPKLPMPRPDGKQPVLVGDAHQ